MADSLDDIRKEPRFWQRLLIFAGYAPGKADGIIGTRTRAAAAQWEQDAASVKAELGSYDERSERNISTLIPEAQRAARQWLRLAKAEAAKRGYDVRIICGTRTYDEQTALFSKRSKVTNARAGQSFHNFGIAWDFGIFKDKSYYGDHEMYSIVGKLYTQVPGTEWGGIWKSFVDQPHIQLNKYSTSSQARRVFEV